MTTPSSVSRLDYLDAVRAFALLLGILFHASISFLPIFIGWAVMDVSTSPVISVFMLVSHSFRMALFFLIAGFFSHMTVGRKGLRTFIEMRLVRIALPFVFGWFLLRPLLVSGWLMGAESLRGDVNILDGLKAGFATLVDLPKDLFVGTHLWFLYYLLLVTTGVLILRGLSRLHPLSRLKLSYHADRVTHWVANSRFAILAVSIPTAACLWFMEHWGMDTPDKSLAPDMPVLLVYGGFFLLGWLLHRQLPLIERFARLSGGRFGLGLFAVLAAITLSGFQTNPAHPQYLVFRAGFVLAYAVMMWSLVALSIGLFRRWFDRPSSTVRYIADSSYWLYLVHLPLVVWLQVAVAEWPLHWSIKLPAVSLITILVSIVLYDLFVRSTVIGAVLNGRRKPRVLFRFGGQSFSREGPALHRR